MFIFVSSFPGLPRAPDFSSSLSSPTPAPFPFYCHYLGFHFPPWTQFSTTDLPCSAISLSLSPSSSDLFRPINFQVENMVIFLCQSPCARERGRLKDCLALSAPSWLKIELILSAGADRGPGKHQVTWLQRHHFPGLCVCMRPQARACSGHGEWAENASQGADPVSESRPELRAFPGNESKVWPWMTYQ